MTDNAEEGRTTTTTNNNNNRDRIKMEKEKLSQLVAEEKGAEEELNNLGDGATAEEQIKPLRLLYKINQEIKKQTTVIESLKADLKAGRYFAKADEIFPPDMREPIYRPDFHGAAALLTRNMPPGAKSSSEIGTIYHSELRAFLNRLKKHFPDDGPAPDDEQVSAADMNSIAPSTSSEASEVSSTGGSSAQGQGGRKPNHAVPQRTRNRNLTKKGKKPCIISGVEGHRGHQMPDAPTCAPWWSLVSLWVVGKLFELDRVYTTIWEERDRDKRELMEHILLEILVLLTTGTKSGNKGIKQSDYNILYVPNPHAMYYDDGYNWVIVPIMTLPEMKVWNGEPYEVAIFVGEHSQKAEDTVNEEYNHFQDGPTHKSAIEAEKQLLGILHEDTINICSNDDMLKVTNVFREFFKALADLHTRSSDEDGVPQEVHPKNWGIIDLAGVVRTLMMHNPTREKVGMDSQKGVEDVIEQLSKKRGSDDNQEGCIQIPKVPSTNCFGGKHVYKTFVTQPNPPDPLLVGTRGTINLGRQWGIRLLPGCPTEPFLHSYSSCSENNTGSTEATPPRSIDFSGTEIAVVSPEDKKGSTGDFNGRCNDIVSDFSEDDGLYNDDVSVITFEDGLED